MYVYDQHGSVGIQSASFRVVAAAGRRHERGAGQADHGVVLPGREQRRRPYVPANATDGNWTTRWASDWSDPQWIQVDLGQSTAIKHVQLGWESAYAQGLPDPDLQRRHQLDHGPLHHDRRRRRRRPSTSPGPAATCGCTAPQRGTTYGYSLYEFGVYA